jgi:hypothetical protein
VTRLRHALAAYRARRRMRAYIRSFAADIDARTAERIAMREARR